MPKTTTVLLYLSYVSKVAGFIAALNVIPGVSLSTGVTIFFIASLLKDTVNRIGDFLDDGLVNGSWKPLLVATLIGLSYLSLTGCVALAAAPRVLSLFDQAWTVYHAVQSVNTGAPLTQAQVLQATASFRPAEANAAYDQLAQKAAQLTAPATPPQAQAQATAALTTLTR